MGALAKAFNPVGIGGELVEKVFPKIETGEVKPTIHATLPITEAEAAHDILYKGQNVGKVVLTVK